MSYGSPTWVSEVSKPVGEAISPRVYIRLKDGANFIYNPTTMLAYVYDKDEAYANVYGDIPSTNWETVYVWERSGCTITEDKAYTPTLDSYGESIYTYLLQDTGSTATNTIRTSFDAGTFNGHKGIIFSICATPYDRGAYNGGTKSQYVTFSIMNKTVGASTEEQVVWQWVNDEPNLISVGTDVTCYGYELIQDDGADGDENWYRFWMGVDIPDEQDLDSWQVLIYPNAYGITNGYSLMTAPQVEGIDISVRDIPSNFHSTQCYEQVGTLLTFTGETDIVSCGPVTYKKDRDYGYIQGGQLQLSLNNADGNLNAYNFEKCWLSLEFGFQDLDHWESAYNGIVYDARYTTDGVVQLSVDDVFTKLNEYTLTRPLTFDVRTTTPFSGEPAATTVDVVSVGDDSNEYDNEYAFDDGTNAGVVFISGEESNVIDQTYTIEFVTSTLFRVKFEDGTYFMESVNYLPKYFSIEDDAQIGYSEWSDAILTLEKEGWRYGENTYAAGDTYEFTTTAARTANQHTPMGMVEHLIEDVVGVKVLNVKDGVYTWFGNEDSPFYVTALGVPYSIYNYADYEETNERYIAGSWQRGDSVLDMLQDLMKISNSSIYTLPEGLIGFFAVDDPELTYGSSTLIKLNGDPETVDTTDLEDGINIISASRDRVAFSNAVRYKYKTINKGKDAEILLTDSIVEDTVNTKTIETKWEINDALAIYAAGVYKVRNEGQQEEVKIDTTLYGSLAQLNRIIGVREPTIGVAGENYQSVSTTIDPASQTCSVVVRNDPFLLLDFAKVDEDTTDDTNKTIL